jgi:hypothetical protein
MIVQPPAIMDYRDPFDGADSNDIGPDWRPEFTNLKRVTNRIQIRTPSANTGRQGAWETYVPVSMYNGGRFLTDNWSIEIPLAAVVGNTATDNGSGMGSGMPDGGPTSGMTLVYAVFQLATSGTTAAIVTNTNASIAAPGATTGQANQTVRATSTTLLSSSDTMRFERRMYSATQSVFSLYRNGSFLISWPDSTGVVVAGNAARRRWFIVCEGNYPIFQSPYYSVALASVRARDLHL